MEEGENNYTEFTTRNKNITQELIDNTPAALQQHPEFGVLPPDAPCADCYELLDERTLKNRVFVKNGTNGSDRLYQQSYHNFNFVDVNGYLRSKDKKLYTTLTPDVYANVGQQNQIAIDLNNDYLSLEKGGRSILFHKNLNLYTSTNGVKQLLHSSDWNNATVGSDGAYITDVFPGVDLEIISLNGAFKTDFIVKSNFSLPQADYLMIEDDVDLPSNANYDLSNSYMNNEGLYVGRLDINDNVSNSSLFNVDGGFYWDDNTYNNTATHSLAYQLDGNKIEYYVPMTYLNDPARVFPVHVDPLLTTSNTVAQASIGSGLLNNGAWLDGCDYFMNVTSPADVTITDIIWKFDYRAVPNAPMRDGGVLFYYNGCRSPMPATNFWFCNTVSSGNCNSGAGVSTLTYFSTCVPAPQCGTYNMNFQLEFFERYDFNSACGSAWIIANSDWIMTVEGRTVEQNSAPTSSNGTTICNGSSTMLTATGSFGVPPYTYLWSSGGTGQTESVTPPNSTTTTYTCTITDACGNTAANSINITTQAQTLFPTPTLSYTMSPASGTPCPVTITVQTNIGTSYSSGPENYSWNFPGGTVLTGGATSGSANGATYGGASGVYTVQYTTAGNYVIGIDMTDGGNCASASASFAICGALPITLTSFDAEVIDDKKIKVNWVTESEINNDYFTVEKSKDGKSFEVVAVVEGAGNSSVPLSYSEIDLEPLNGVSYYRLKQTDYDKKFSYSDLIKVEIVDAIGELTVYPNPVENITNLSFMSAIVGAATVEIHDLTGKRIATYVHQVTKGENKFTFSTEELTSGIYFLTVKSGDELSSIKFSK
jgi:hypothetical protein